MRTHKYRTRLTAMALAALLLLSLFQPCAALEGDGGRLSIRSAEDLVEFSRNCTLNTWSRGKTVSLEADIDLTGLDFSPIPTFGGTFEGNGHTISGLSLAEGVSCQGLFRYIQEGAVVRELHVTGTVAAAGEQRCLGGIAGSNEGTILDCSFRGSVEGKTQVGGIAGINEAAGSIYRCTVEGSVTGDKSTGGIAGQNSGTITGCVNKSAVNTVHQEKEQSLEESFDHLNREDVLDTTTDTGGIAGFSNGVLQSCRNLGHVGYPHVGYNVGGVAGRSSGYLEDCTNSGAVEGRKDVGGIAGQIAPNIRLIFTPDTIDELRTELDRLDVLANQALDHTDSSRNTIHDRLDQLSGHAQSASDSADRLSDLMTDWTDGTIDTINDAANTLADTLDRLEDITANGGDILDALADGMDRLEDSLDRMADAMGIGEEGLDALSEATELFRSGLSQAQDGLDLMGKAIHDLSNALVIDDPDAVEAGLTQLRSGAQQLTSALNQCGDALGQIALLFQEGSLGGDELSQCLYQLADGFSSAAQATSQLVQGVETAVNGLSLDWDLVQESADYIAQALEKFSIFCDTTDRSMKKLREALSRFADLSGVMEGALADLADAMDVFEGATQDMGDVADKVHDLFEDLSNRDPVEFDKLGDSFHQAEDDLHGAMNALGDQMDLLRNEMKSSGDALSGDLRALSDQFQVVADLILDAFSADKVPNVDDLWDDVSQERINNTTLGKAKGCANLGAVKGDLNVGGIAGSMAIERDFDPEDDVTEVGEESLDFRYETRAILQTCVNQGPVTAKKDAVGGTVGRMDLGYVLGCENYGAVKSTNGDYAGGIAGISNSTIRDCWSKCSLSGGSYVGGIVGCGYEIYQCVSLVSVDEAEGYFGAVAGQWDREEGAISANRFVSGSLAGVDGISYAGQAEPMAYGDLILEEGVPTPFHRLTVTYVAEEKVLETLTFSYGQDLSSHKVPDVPDKAGYYGVWEDIGERAITVDHVVEAVYTPYTTTMASAAMRDRVHPVLLVEGAFDGQAALQAELLEQDGGMERWTVTLTGGDVDGAHVIRYAPPKEWKGASLRLLTPEGSTAVESAADGSYVVFQASGSSLTFEAVRESRSAAPILPALAGLGLAVLAAVLVLRKKGLLTLPPVRRR